jgi:hypothetical protein
VFSLVPGTASADRWFQEARVLGAVDAGRNLTAARSAGAAWDRVLFLWSAIQPNGPDEWRLRQYIEQTGIRKSLDSGLPLVAVVQSTPQWAAGNTSDGAAAVPTGLDFPIEDRRNTFGRFVHRLVRELNGRIDAWIIWNEPDFRPGDAGDWLNWSGNAEDLFKVVRAGSRAVKAADPDALVVFPATAYYPDVVNGRELYLARVLREAAKLPDARPNGFYFDAVAVNLYCTVPGIYDIFKAYRSILDSYAIAKPIWLTETNCQQYNDATSPRDAQSRITTMEQASFLVQAVAMAKAAGYDRIGWYSMVDHNDSIPDRWGLVRPDGSPRPAFHAFHLASRYLDHPGEARFLPADGTAGAHSWKVWRVVTDDPRRNRRVHVLWAGPDAPRTIRVPVRGVSAQLVDVLGRAETLRPDRGWWALDLPPARAPMPTDPPGSRSLGDPVLVVEDGVPPLTPTGPLRYGLPPDASRFFPATGYTVENDRIWDFQAKAGGTQVLGNPVSYAFTFQGGTVQLFERSAIFLPPGGTPHLLDLAGPAYLPYASKLLAPGGREESSLPLGSLLKGLLLGSAPSELLGDARTSRFFAQYHQDSPNFVARPKDLPNTNLVEAF